MEHSGAISWSLKDDMEEAANSLFSCTGHLNPNDENTDTTYATRAPKNIQSLRRMYGERWKVQGWAWEVGYTREPKLSIHTR